MQELRNIAIIAHVDHGKTTLVDKILYQCNLFRTNENPGDLILDNNDLERERGITILSKNVSVIYNDVKINIIDTPGHADFGGEVERVLNMADGVLLLVDAFEGPMPQTRFVLQKAIELNLKVILVINKVDKPNCNPELVQEGVFDLMFNLNATEEQLDFPTVYGSSKEGWMSADWNEPTTTVCHLLDVILEKIPAPIYLEGTPQLLITSIDYSSYVGRIAIGRVTRGVFKKDAMVSIMKKDGKILKQRIKELMVFDGLVKIKAKEVGPGEICAMMGIEGFAIGDTIADNEFPEALKTINVDEPTMSMLFTINDSPFYGKDGKYVTSRHLRERLEREIEKNLALRIEDTNNPDSIMVYGRGILHLSILIETMRREGYEIQVGQPRVIIKEIDGIKNEPIESLTIDVPEAFAGKAIEFVSTRKGEMIIMEPKNDHIHLEFKIPSRGIIGLRNNVLTLTEGEAIIAHRFLGFEPWKGEIPNRKNGVLISMDTGTIAAYAINKLQDRGSFFLEPTEDVYAGQIIGEHVKAGDIVINVTKTKKLSNMRASGSDEKLRIAPAVKFSLEQFMEYIQEDEYVELTPKHVRIRKIILDENDRKRESKKLQVTE